MKQLKQFSYKLTTGNSDWFQVGTDKVISIKFYPVEIDNDVVKFPRDLVVIDFSDDRVMQIRPDHCAAISFKPA